MQSLVFKIVLFELSIKLIFWVVRLILRNTYQKNMSVLDIV